MVKKYGDDAGGRQAALITYYGFLSIFPLLLLGVAILSRVLADHPDLRRRLITEIVPQALRPTVEHSLATLPTSTIPFVAGLVGLLLSGTGVVYSGDRSSGWVRRGLRARFRWSHGSPLGPGPALGVRASAGAWWPFAARPARRSSGWMASKITPPTAIPIPAPARTSRG